MRIIASTYFVDADGGDWWWTGGGWLARSRSLVIGDPATMRTALNIPGGVVASVADDGGNVSVEEREAVEVTQLHAPIKLRTRPSGLLTGRGRRRFTRCTDG